MSYITVDMDIPDLSGEIPGGAQAATGCSSQALAVGALFQSWQWDQL